ncbi:MAG: hypothetical protein O3A63_15625 [Proteobacteria bacterium]|nr:hypothetical protein [Pseudomonadota bacterium]
MKVWLLLALTLSAATDAATTRALVIAGLGGEATYREAFDSQAQAISEALADTTDVVTLLIGSQATTDALEATLGSWAQQSVADDALMLLYIGHGSFDEEHFRFNLPGRDPTAAQLATWLDAHPARRQLIIVCGSSSGAVHEFLKAPHRTVMTATRSGGQRNATHLCGYLTRALTLKEADTDKDQEVSAEEAFAFGVSRVEAYFDRQQEMASENPTRTGPFTTLKLAALQVYREQLAAAAPLYARRDEIEQAIEALRAVRDDYTTEAYFSRLQQLLLDMAVVQSEIETLENPQGDG